MNTSVVNPTRQAPVNLGRSFTLAAWLVIVGVLASWLVLKQDQQQIASNLPEIPQFDLATSPETSSASFLELADQAYAAGRIAQPESNNALYFFRQQLQLDTTDVDALNGLKRVGTFLINDAERAMLEGDWSLALRQAQAAAGIESTSIAAGSVLARLDRRDRVLDLNRKAVVEFDAGNLTKPKGANALASYRAVLQLDPANETALQGITRVAQRLAALAQTAAFSENHKRAKELIADAKRIAPGTPGIAETEKLIAEWTNMVEDQAVQNDLLAASEAYQRGYLLDVDAPDGKGAPGHYRAVLSREPDSPTAKAGIDLVQTDIIGRGWVAARQENLGAMAAHIADAKDAGASDSMLLEIRGEYEFLDRRERARAGIFDSVVALSELVIRRRSEPVLPRSAEGGYVELLLTVDEEGLVQDIEIAGSDNEELHTPSIEAVEKWRFEPLLEGGRPIPVRTGVRFSFQG